MFAHTVAAIFYPETTAYSDVTSANKVTSSIRSVLNSIFKVKFCWLTSEDHLRGRRLFLLHPLRITLCAAKWIGGKIPDL